MVFLSHVFLVFGAGLCSAAPVSRFFRDQANAPSLGTVATVDCSNREAVEFVSKTHANFRCVYPENRRSSVVNSDDSGPLLFRYSTGLCPQGKVFNSRTRNCDSASSPFPSNLQSANQVREDTSDCPPGKMYVPSIDMCLDAVKPLKTGPLESDNLIVEQAPLEITAFSSDIQSTNDCKPDEVFNSEISLCMPNRNPPRNKRPLSTLNLVKEDNRVPLEIQSFSSVFQSSSDCKPDEIWVSEISTCVSTKTNRALESASLIRSSFQSVKPNTARDCAPGEVFVSEIGICQSASPSKVQRPIVSDSLIKETHSPVAVQENIKCPAGQVLVSELNICLPYNIPNKKPSPPSSSSLVKEPEKLEIVSFETSVSKDDCKPGQFYLSELGICV